MARIGGDNKFITNEYIDPLFSYPIDMITYYAGHTGFFDLTSNSIYGDAVFGSDALYVNNRKIIHFILPASGGYRHFFAVSFGSADNDPALLNVEARLYKSTMISVFSKNYKCKSTKISSYDGYKYKVDSIYLVYTKYADDDYRFSKVRINLKYGTDTSFLDIYKSESNNVEYEINNSTDVLSEVIFSEKIYGTSEYDNLVKIPIMNKFDISGTKYENSIYSLSSPKANDRAFLDMTYGNIYSKINYIILCVLSSTKIKVNTQPPYYDVNIGGYYKIIPGSLFPLYDKRKVLYPYPLIIGALIKDIGKELKYDYQVSNNVLIDLFNLKYTKTGNSITIGKSGSYNIIENSDSSKNLDNIILNIDKEIGNATLQTESEAVDTFKEKLLAKFQVDLNRLVLAYKRKEREIRQDYARRRMTNSKNYVAELRNLDSDMFAEISDLVYRYNSMYYDTLARLNVSTIFNSTADIENINSIELSYKSYLLNLMKIGFNTLLQKIATSRNEFAKNEKLRLEYLQTLFKIFASMKGQPMIQTPKDKRQETMADITNAIGAGISTYMITKNVPAAAAVAIGTLLAGLFT